MDYVKGSLLKLSAGIECYRLQSTLLSRKMGLIPIIFILSPGVDPHTQLEAFAKTKGAEFIPVSLGQGQAKKARDKIFEGTKNGTWLYLANSLNFLKEL
jgi:hypothetical protein